MHDALVIGGTRFIGRHLVEDLLAHDYSVTLFNRGTHPNPFADTDTVEHIEGDRTNESALELAAGKVDPEVVFDCVAYHPREVRAATTIFDTVEAYVYISSGAVYAAEHIPKREAETPLESCTREQATDDAWETYANRKAEGDRAIESAAQNGVRAMSVRPCIVYGPYDYSERMDYWINRVNSYETVVIPGDGTNLWHRAYVEDVGRALRVVAEEGEAGHAYNVGDRRLLTLEETVELIADVLETDIDVVPASERELAAGELSSDEFVLYREYPHVLDTSKLTDLGWDSTPVQEAMARTVQEHAASDRDGSEHDPGRDAEERILGVLDTIGQG